MRFCLFVLTLLANADAATTEREVNIQLNSPAAQEYDGWSLKLDNDQVYTFEEDGSIKMTVPEDSKSFEVIDSKKAVRFFGMWRHYPEMVLIEIGNGKGLMVHEVVTASRISQSSWEVAGELDVVRPDEQSERAVTQTSDWLKEKAEISLQKTNLGGGSPIMRGMSGNRVLLMVDGFRLNNAIYRLGVNQYMNTVPASQIEQIEVLSGPSGVQYGSDGLGGTVHMRSADPASNDGSNATYNGFYSSADGTNSHQIQRLSRSGSRRRFWRATVHRFFLVGWLAQPDLETRQCPPLASDQYHISRQSCSSHRPHGFRSRSFVGIPPPEAAPARLAL